MPLPLPNLDTRRWADLVDEGRAIVPRYAGSWTDHNVHDPGITLIELFAFLVENLLYRVNRIPERHRRKFLALAGFESRPPAGARAILNVRLATGTGRIDLPAELVVIAASERGQIPFSTTADTSLLEVELRSVLVFDGSGFTDCGRFAIGGVSYAAFGPDPSSAVASQPALYLGFDRPPSPGAVLSLFVFVPASSPDTVEQLLAETAMRSCPPVPPRIPCEPCPPSATRDPWCAGERAAPADQAAAGDVDAPRIPPHHSARVAWEYLALDGWRPLDAPPGEVDDRTRSLTLDGWVRIRVPGPMDSRALGGLPEQRYWIRCRFAGGSYDAAPVIAGPVMNAVPVVQRVHVPPGDATAPGAALDGSGLPDQVIRLSQPKVADARIVVETSEPTGTRRWEQRPDFDSSGPLDLHFTLDADVGLARFGNGERGRVPPDGAQFRLSYASTEGARGSVAAGTSWSLAETPSNQGLLASGGLTVAGVALALQRVTNPLAAAGGRDSEPLSSVQQRAADLLWAHERLVQLAGTDERSTLDQLDARAVRARPVPQRGTTGLDFERLALGVPGTVVRRAHACPNLDPFFPCVEAMGTITVVIVPELPSGRPMPSPGLLRAVRGYLGRRRLLGTRVLVVGPDYLTVTVKATVAARRNADAAAVRQAVVEALHHFLHPLEGGPDGLGWPFGRDVYRSEILATIDAVAGVDHVVECTLRADDAEVPCANVCLPPTCLVDSGGHQVEVIRE